MNNLQQESKSNKTNLQSHKVETNQEDLIYYLEELYQMDMLNEKEMDIYERYQYGDFVSRKEWVYVANQSYKYQFEAF